MKIKNKFAKIIISFTSLFIAVGSFFIPLVSQAETNVGLEHVSAHNTSMDVTVNILTGGETVGLKIKYGIQPGVYDEETTEFYRGATTGTTQASATAHMLDLTPGTDYYFGIVNSDTGVEYISSFNPTTSSAGQTLESGGGASSTSTCVKGQYCLLAPLPGLNSYDVKKGNVGEYLNILFKIGIGIAGVLAVVMLVLGAIQYMSSDSISEKGAGKDRMTNAIIGLILALGSIVLLRTLNNNLTIIKLNVDEVKITVGEMREDGSIKNIYYTGVTGDCPEKCVELSGAGGVNVPIKAGITSGTKIEKSIKTKLQAFTTKLSTGQINGRWGVTEAWKPSRSHKAECHPKGTCVDANFTYTPGASDIKSFLQLSEASGLCAEYEVKTAAEKTTLVNGGVNASQILVLGDHISAAHFSVYGGSCN